MDEVTYNEYGMTDGESIVFAIICAGLLMIAIILGAVYSGVQ